MLQPDQTDLSKSESKQNLQKDYAEQQKLVSHSGCYHQYLRSNTISFSGDDTVLIIGCQFVLITGFVILIQTISVSRSLIIVQSVSEPLKSSLIQKRLQDMDKILEVANQTNGSPRHTSEESRISRSNSIICSVMSDSITAVVEAIVQ